MSREIFLFRHFEDQQSVDNYRDGGISKGYEPQLEQVVSKLVDKLQKDEHRSVLFVTSPQQRVQESIDIISSEVHDQTGVKTTIFEDDRLRAIRHGDYSDSTSEQLDLAQKYAWDAYVDQVFHHENLYYRHGDPLVQSDGSAMYPELVGRFRSVGENQLEFTIRTYSFILEILEVYDNFHDRKGLIVVGSHMAPLMRLGEMAKLSEKNQPPRSMALPELGKMYLSEWNELSNLQNDPELANIIIPGGSCLLDLDQIRTLEPLIRHELDLQKAKLNTTDL